MWGALSEWAARAGESLFTGPLGLGHGDLSELSSSLKQRFVVNGGVRIGPAAGWTGFVKPPSGPPEGHRAWSRPAEVFGASSWYHGRRPCWSPPMRLAWVLGSFLLLVSAVSSRAATLHVPGQFTTIQEALDASANGDTVLVAPGTYNDIDVRSPFGTVAAVGFVPPGVALISEAGAEATTLDMSLAEGAAPNVCGLRVDDVPLGQPTLIQGFTITGAPPTGGSGMVIRLSEGVSVVGCRFVVDVPLGQTDVLRGGTDWFLSSGRVEGCEFLACEGQFGAGLDQTEGTITIVQTVFRGCANEAIRSGSTGGITIIEGCTFEFNESALGAVVSIGNGSVRGSLFLDNRGVGSGAAFKGSGAEVSGCLFDGNEIDGFGAAIIVSGFGNVIENNTIVRSRKVGGTGFGSAIYVVSSNQTHIWRNIIAHSSGGPAIERARSATVIAGCNVFYANVDGDAEGYTLRESDRVVDPQFCDVAGADWTLRPESPCLPENSQGCDRIGAHDVGCGTVSVTPTTFGRIKAAYRDGGRP